MTFSKRLNFETFFSAEGAVLENPQGRGGTIARDTLRGEGTIVILESCHKTLVPGSSNGGEA